MNPPSAGSDAIKKSAGSSKLYQTLSLEGRLTRPGKSLDFLKLLFKASGFIVSDAL